MKAAIWIVMVGCSSSTPSMSSADAPPPLAPGVTDSSQASTGTPDADETAFWTAMLAGDDTGRATAIAKLTADESADPTRGYDAFLVGANAYIAPTTVLTALANGTPPPAFTIDKTAKTDLTQSLANLTDPFYLGFASALIAQLDLLGGDSTDATALFATGEMKNPVATTFVEVIDDLAQKQAAKALTDMYAVLEHCNGGALDRAGGDAAAYVAKQNAGTLAHRQCYTGFYAPHASPAELVIIGDLHALNGDATAATAYYTAAKGATGYATWPLAPLVERRLAGTQPATLPLTTEIAATCGTCHTNAL